MHLRALLPDFSKHLAAQGRAPRTLDAYERTVFAFLEALGDRQASSSDVEGFLARARTDGRPRCASTKRAELMALRALFRFAAREGVVLDPTDGITVKRQRRPDPAVAMPADLAPLYKAAARSSTPGRNTTILACLHVLGLRVHELAGLDVDQVDLVAAVLRRVRGKGGTITDFPLPAPLVALLSGWLRERAMLGHAERGPLFPTERPSSSRTGRLSIRSLQRLVNRLAIDAGLGRALGPHALRHGTATSAISLGVDVPTTAELMRHASIATTQT
ncbi:MAG: tyrosine-type recombinase/integrase, partial [Sandaracinaceae bacterium]|nr:tyrosine-type recombinase/integrase [Sandaracinaceae bacterium]